MFQRRYHGGAFNARVAIEAIAGHKTVNEIANEIHLSQVAEHVDDGVGQFEFDLAPFFNCAEAFPPDVGQGPLV